MTNISGQKFGRWTAVKPDLSRLYYWEFICECGNTKTLYVHNVKRGLSKSCGCFHSESASARAKIDKRTHGSSLTCEHKCWVGIRQRCENENDKDFGRYGGRGIAVCERWNVFENFLADMGKKPSKAHSIDRVDVNGNYEPANCRWATVKEQNKNRRDTIRVEAFGKSGCLADFLRSGSKEYSRAQGLIGRGLSPAAAVYTVLGT